MLQYRIPLPIEKEVMKFVIAAKGSLKAEQYERAKEEFSIAVATKSRRAAG